MQCWEYNADTHVLKSFADGLIEFDKSHVGVGGARSISNLASGHSRHLSFG